MEHLSARCLMCGKTYELSQDHKDFKKMSENPATATFICEFCSKRIRHEADEKNKERKPM